MPHDAKLQVRHERLAVATAGVDAMRICFVSTLRNHLTQRNLIRVLLNVLINQCKMNGSTTKEREVARRRPRDARPNETQRYNLEATCSVTPVSNQMLPCQNMTSRHVLYSLGARTRRSGSSRRRPTARTSRGQGRPGWSRRRTGGAGRPTPCCSLGCRSGGHRL